jgi:hypothetical protein
MLGDGGGSINDLPMAARLHKALYRDHTSKLGSLEAPSRRQRQSEGETLKLLMTTHFFNSEVQEDMASSSSARRARLPDWRMAARVVRYRRVQ